MTEMPAQVIGVSDAYALIEIGPRQVGCGRCHESGGCGASPPTGEAGKRVYRMRNDVGARVGDDVLVTIPDGALLKVSLFAYFLPVLLVILSAAVGALISETLAIVAALGGLGLGLILLRLAQGRMLMTREPLLSMRIKTCAFHSTKGIHSC